MDAEEIKQVAAMYGSAVEVRRKDIHIQCPFGQYHSRGVDTHQGLSVKIAPAQRSVCWCFSCGTSGTLLHVFESAAALDPSLLPVAQFISETDGASLSGALARLHRSAVPNETPNTDWATYSMRCARLVPAYLVGRGVIKDDVRRWQLGFDSELQRAIFPVRDEHKNVIGCLRRGVHDGQDPKYKDTPGAVVWKKKVFYGEHLIDRTRDTARLVEGPMGAIFASRVLPNVLAMMGADTGCETERVDKLLRWGIKTVILMLDSDKKGKQAVYGRMLPEKKWKPGLRELLRRHFVVKVAKLPPGEDPDDVVRRDPTALKVIERNAVYLEAKAPLTARPSSRKFTRPTEGSSCFSEYMRDRSSGKKDAE